MSEHRTVSIFRLLLAAITMAATAVPSISFGARAGGNAAPGAIPQDTRIVINAPAFRMDLFDNGKLVKSYRISIGYPEFPLPTGERSADEIIISPSWTPPAEAWVETPRSKVKAGEKIPAGDKLNPLGPLKVPIGLPSLIHGGKPPAAIGAFGSHGCVGLTTPQVNDFAARLAQLSGTQLSAQQIAEAESNKKDTQPVKLARPVPVELRYETITVENGQLHIYRDVYARGTDTIENLQNVLQAYGVGLNQLNPAETAQVNAALKEMARDALGRPVLRPAPAVNSKQAKVTRVIRGRKEVVIPIAALQGKGYPAPVDMQGPQPPKRTASRSHRRR